jgi:hypothetical protein
MKCVVTGTVLKVYKAARKNRDGQEAEVDFLDLYDGDELIKIAKIPENTFGAGESVSLRLKVYGNQYGISAVYDATVGSEVPPRK